jgi:putative ABC transport system permease protein
MIFTAIVFQQVKFMQQQNLGIDKNNIIVINNTGRLKTNKEAFGNALKQQTGIITASYSNNSFPGVNNTTVFREAASEQDHIMGIYYADYEHQNVMKFELKEGRYFSRDFPSDSSAIILNEAAVREFNFDNALDGEILYNENGNEFKKYKVIGVIKNFNFESFKSAVRPLAIVLGKDQGNLMIRYEGNPSEALSSIEKLWKEYATGEPFEYQFLDQSFDQLFRAEQRMGTIFGIFSGLAIFVACLGLFALSAFTSEQRTKEIGIRKALGASSWSVLLLLSKEFTRLVLFAFVPAAAASWYISSRWLQDFAYRIEISPVIIVLSGITAILIAWATVSLQSIRTARLNPVVSLRYE